MEETNDEDVYGRRQDTNPLIFVAECPMEEEITGWKKQMMRTFMGGERL